MIRVPALGGREQAKMPVPDGQMNSELRSEVGRTVRQGK